MALGWTDRLADYLNAADLLALSSRTEGHSNVAGEALMLGVPVATTDCGDHAPVVERAGGRVVPTEDPLALAGAMGLLLDDPPPRDRVRAAAEGELSVDRMVDSTLAVYRRLLAD